MTLPCDGCDQEIPDGEDGRIWCNAPLGMTTLTVHKTQECGRAALARHPEYKMRPGNRPPLSREERDKQKLEGDPEELT